MPRPTRLSLLALLALLLFLPACQALGVDRWGYEKVYRSLTANVLSGKEVSMSTVEVLHRWDLTETFEDDPRGTILELHERALEETDANVLFALSELSYYVGHEEEDRAHYFMAAIYAYLCLFDEKAAPPSPYDRRFRIACDLYNRGLAQAMEPVDDEPIEFTSHGIDLPVGQVDLVVEYPGGPEVSGLFRRFRPSDVYNVRGLSWRVREHGLGVPLIAIPEESLAERHPHVPPNLLAPATAFVRFDGGLADLAGGLPATLEIHRALTEVEVGGRVVPLESDVTTPLAYMLGEEFQLFVGIRRFFKGDDADMEPGLYMMNAYAPGKIPVVFVHGTASSPSTWAEMFNGLLGDPELRERFQFWFFLYTTGNPIPYSAAQLRNSLTGLVEELNPDESDPSLRRMVLVGHSQGGVLVRMMVTDSGDRIWNSASVSGDYESIEELPIDDEGKELLRDCMYFQRLPFVERTIFLSTPHRGSFLAGNWLGRFFGRRVDLGTRIRSTFKKLVEGGVLPEEAAEDMPTSIDNMTPDNSFVLALGDAPIHPDVRYHSIIAVKGDGPHEEEHDGVVEYESAHVEGSESELVVRSGHSVQDRAPAIFEVRRILRVHAVEIEIPAEDAP